jgi:polyhydroxyalkanoate synthase
MKSQTAAPKPSGQNPSWDDWVQQVHGRGAGALREWTKGLQVDEATRTRLAFAVEQWIAAVHPDNFLATNPDALQRALDSRGRSIQDGMQLMLADIAKGRVSNTDETAFEVGRNIATTPGSVVMRNELVELIQYAPTTAKVGELPLLMVPPCINKYYILDLSESNSLVRYALDRGNTVFMVSWRNPGPEQSSLGWDDYLRLGVVEPMEAATRICGTDQVNALGFCVGGTILATALAALAAKGQHPAASLTLLTTLLDFTDVGQLGMFVDPASVAYREAVLGAGGLLSGKELAATFSFLRPRDLMWNYVANGYLKGEAPSAFDLLYWNADSTNLPGPMYAWYLRNLYLENKLQSGDLVSLDEPVNLGALTMPAFVYASREDHIVPWQTAFTSTRLLGGESTFVLGASGHIAGVVNPPARHKRSYWSGPLTKSRHRLDSQAWLENAGETPGSWWGIWADWVAARRGRDVAARRKLGNRSFKPVADAPGEYVKFRI